MVLMIFVMIFWCVNKNVFDYYRLVWPEEETRIEQKINESRTQKFLKIYPARLCQPEQWENLSDFDLKLLDKCLRIAFTMFEYDASWRFNFKDGLFWFSPASHLHCLVILTKHIKMFVTNTSRRNYVVHELINRIMRELNVVCEKLLLQGPKDH